MHSYFVVVHTVITARVAIAQSPFRIGPHTLGFTDVISSGPVTQGPRVVLDFAPSLVKKHSVCFYQNIKTMHIKPSACKTAFSLDLLEFCRITDTHLTNVDMDIQLYMCRISLDTNKYCLQHMNN